MFIWSEEKSLWRHLKHAEENEDSKCVSNNHLQLLTGFWTQKPFPSLPRGKTWPKRKWGWKDKARAWSRIWPSWEELVSVESKSVANTQWVSNSWDVTSLQSPSVHLRFNSTRAAYPWLLFPSPLRIYNSIVCQPDAIPSPVRHHCKLQLWPRVCIFHRA